jgi:hypothetical protein
MEYGYWALGLVTWSSLMLLIMMSGDIPSGSNMKMAIGVLFGIVGTVPGFCGLGVALTVFNKDGSNPVLLWVAVIWGAVVSAVWILLSVLGTLQT